MSRIGIGGFSSLPSNKASSTTHNDQLLAPLETPTSQWNLAVLSRRGTIPGAGAGDSSVESGKHVKLQWSSTSICSDPNFLMEFGSVFNEEHCFRDNLCRFFRPPMDLGSFLTPQSSISISFKDSNLPMEFGNFFNDWHFLIDKQWRLFKFPMELGSLLSGKSLTSNSLEEKAPEVLNE